MLEDEDRLVRESACLALGLMKAGARAEEAVAEKWLVKIRLSREFLREITHQLSLLYI